MKKIHYIYTAAAAIIMSLGACQNNESPAEGPTQEEVTLNFNVDATSHTRAVSPDTRAAATSLDPRAQVGVYFAPDNTTALTAVAGANANHLYQGNGTTESPVYWNDYTSALDIYAYSPRHDSAPLNDDGTGLNWSVNTVQDNAISLTASDLLVSNDLRGLTYTLNKGGQGTLNFTHALAKLRINIIDNSASGSTDSYTTDELADATVSIVGLSTTCDVIFVDLEAGTKTISNLADAKPITPMQWDTPADGEENQLENRTAATTYEAICIPQNVTSGAALATIKVTSTASGLAQTYTVKATEAYALKQGMTNVLNVTLTKSDIDFAFTVAPWGTTTTSQSVKIDNLAGGSAGGNTHTDIVPADGDLLDIAYLTDGTTPTTSPAEMGQFIYRAAAESDQSKGTWKTEQPFYWDSFAYAAEANSYTFAALYTPNATPATGSEKDYLAGTATAKYGAPLKFEEMKHSMSRLTIKLVDGEGYTKGDMKSATVELAVGYLMMDAQPAAGKAHTTKAATAALALTHNTEAEADAEANLDANAILNTLTLCPQTWEKNQVIAIVQMPDGGPSYTVRATATDGFALTAGEHTTFTVTISKTGISTAFKVTAWETEKNSGEGELDDPTKKD